MPKSCSLRASIAIRIQRHYIGATRASRVGAIALSLAGAIGAFTNRTENRRNDRTDDGTEIAPTNVSWIAPTIETGSVPSCPIELQLPAQIAGDSGEDTALARRLAGCADLLADRRGVRTHALEPAVAIVLGRVGQANAVGFVHGKPRMIAAACSARHAALRVSIPIVVQLFGVAGRPLERLAVRFLAALPQLIALRRGSIHRSIEALERREGGRWGDRRLSV